MSYELYPFQTKAQDDLTQAAVNGSRRLLLQCPTGGGKTLIASKIIAHATGQNFNVLMLGHRREIIWQTVEKLKAFGLDPGVIMSGEIYDPTCKVQVASIQTLHSYCIRRMSTDFPKADLVVIDEAHGLSGSKSWRRILDEYKDSLILGLTATPISKGGIGLAELFDEMIKCPTIQELTDQGYLAPAKYIIPSLPDLRGLHVRMGDYVESEIEAVMDTPKLVGGVVENWTRFASDRQTLVYAVSIKHSIHLTEGFKAIGIKAAHVDGDMKTQERDHITGDFRAGKLQVLVSCGVFIEGTDFPQVSCISFARPTKSLRLMLQALGRGLRPFPGKQNCLILDHSGIYYEFGPVNQDWDWSLDYGKGQTINSLMAKKKKEKLKRTITCETCFLAYEGQINCPACGAIPKRGGKDVLTYDAWLLEADALEIKPEKKIDQKEFYLMVKGYLREKGKNENAAFYKFQDKFPGIKPPWAWKDLDPIAPSLEVRSWIRSRNIRWAKGRAKAAMQNNLSQPAPQPGATP